MKALLVIFMSLLGSVYPRMDLCPRDEERGALVMCACELLWDPPPRLSRCVGPYSAEPPSDTSVTRAA